MDRKFPKRNLLGRILHGRICQNFYTKLIFLSLCRFNFTLSKFTLGKLSGGNFREVKVFWWTFSWEGGISHGRNSPKSNYKRNFAWGFLRKNLFIGRGRGYFPQREKYFTHRGDYPTTGTKLRNSTENKFFFKCKTY